jgi:hypothetical protein
MDLDLHAAMEGRVVFEIHRTELPFRLVTIELELLFMA